MAGFHVVGKHCSRRLLDCIGSWESCGILALQKLNNTPPNLRLVHGLWVGSDACREVFARDAANPKRCPYASQISLLGKSNQIKSVNSISKSRKEVDP